MKNENQSRNSNMEKSKMIRLMNRIDSYLR